jgi:hypothetical protein
MKPHIKRSFIFENLCWQCECDTWIGWGRTPLQAYCDWAAYALYGGTCA